MKFGKVLVLGATGGIGLAIGQAIFPESEELILIGRNTKKCQSLRLRYDRQSHVRVLQMNLLEWEQLRRYLQEEVPDLVINCTGIGKLTRADEVGESFREELWNLNYQMPMQVTREMLTLQRKWQKPLKVVHLCSLASLYPHPYLADYSASKAALLSYHLALAEEVRQENSDFQIACYVLGAVQTDFFPQTTQHKLGGKSLQMKAQAVASEVLKSILQGKSYAVIGRRYQVLSSLLGILPQRFRLQMMAKYLKKGL